MRIPRKLLLLLACCLAVSPIACRGTRGPERAATTPSTRSSETAGLAAPPIEGPPAPTPAETIAARARQDLLESMAFGPGQPDGVASSEGLSGSRANPVITWSGSEAQQTDPETGSPVAGATIDASSPNGAAAAITTHATTDITTLCNELARALHDRSQDGMTPMRDLTVLAALAMLDPERAVNAEAFQSLTDDERITLEAIQQWFLAMEGGLDDQEAVLDTVLEAVRGLQASLRRTPRFGLSGTSLVTRVGGFGDVDEWTLRNEQETYNFIAHSGQDIILYLELEGFDSRLDKQGRWETATSQQLIIYSDRDGIPVWRESWQTATDRARTRRHDYFTAQKLTIPSNLSVGKYQLKVRVRDEQTQAESEATIPFVMTAAILSP